ncbi:PAS domain-containing sensor histidine kinase [Dickeya fangzhongdai]|uniref:PAS domain-containing sensor histidine kinase n=1 Tax=Dickeya fangzhongdai TaxID=1778540 RepID=UPI0004F6E88F|nr:PAS domain S-box protein [Dickeya fangzhongdai]AIR67755.1 histidine kinase [Dickeya fangzhongdai]KGT96570.1 histidine kinase [Dickeya fangzhongdai]WPD75891.1 PAS domain S-box protein [Dickeya fangzhongdai]
MLYTPTSPQPHHPDDVPPLELVDFAFSRIKDAIYIVNDMEQFCYANDEAYRMLGYSRREFRRMRIQDIDLGWTKEETNRHWSDPRCWKRGLTFETRHKTRFGMVLPVEVSVNHFLHKGRKYSMCVVRDIRERKHIEQLAYAREQEFRALVENTPDLITRFDPQLNCQYANPATLAHLRFTAEQLRGRRLTDLLPNARCAQRILQLVQMVVDSESSVEGELEEDIGATETRHRVIHHIRCVPEFDQSGKLTSILTVGRDITAIRYAEKKLEDSHMQLRLLARQREISREEERKHIAREIHDELGQHLTSMRMSLSLMRMQFARDNPHMLTQLQNLMALSDKTIQVVRHVATRLRPNVLDMGLTPALEWLRDDFIRQYRCPCLLRAPEPEVVLNDECATAAFRVVQESLTNIARYAEATQVVIALENREGLIVLSVRDNGKGFDAQARKPHAFGLMSMKERGRMLGGEVVIESQPGAGTLVRLTFPQDTA